MKLQSGAYEGAYSFRSRFENGEGSNPEELIAAAHAGCFSMALSDVLADNGYDPESVDTTATVSLDMLEEGPAITKVHLKTNATVSDLDENTLKELAETAKSECPVSRALAGAEITVDATLS